MNKNSLILLPTLFVLLALLALPNASLAQSALTDDANVNCSADDDDDDGHESASKNTGGGGTNCGARPSLSLSSSGKVYIKFRLSSTLPANTPGSDVARATLKLYLRDVAAAGTIDIYVVAGAWSEKTITANNAPPLGSLIAAAVSVQQSMKDQFLVVDLTSVVQQWLGTDGAGTGGIVNHGVALVARNGARATFDSKENTQTSHEPQLNIQRAGSAGQQGPPGPQGPTGPQGPHGPTGSAGIQQYLGGLDVAKRLNPITFAWKEDGRRDIGFGAEEVAKVEPLLTFTNEKGEIEGVHYAQITTVLVNAVKEQQAQIEALTKQIENLTSLVCRLNSSMKVCRKMEHQPR